MPASKNPLVLKNLLATTLLLAITNALLVLVVINIEAIMIVITLAQLNLVTINATAYQLVALYFKPNKKDQAL